MTEPYDVIVADPPWPVKKLTHRARPNQIAMDYRVMSVDEIRALPVGKLGKDVSWAFLWTTQKHLASAFEVLSGWGYSYLLTMAWEKTFGRSSGMPLFGFRWNVEFVLVGRRGPVDLWPSRPLIPACFDAPNFRHSEKPDRFYELIEPLGRTRLDLFARRERPGWDAWGDQVPSVPLPALDCV